MICSFIFYRLCHRISLFSLIPGFYIDTFLNMEIYSIPRFRFILSQLTKMIFLLQNFLFNILNMLARGLCLYIYCSLKLYASVYFSNFVVCIKIFLSHQKKRRSGINCVWWFCWKYACKNNLKSGIIGDKPVILFTYNFNNFV